MLGELSGTLEELIIREGVVTIGSQAFCYDTDNMLYYEFSVLKKVVLPDSLKTIGQKAFKDNIQLKSMQPAQTAGEEGLLLPSNVTAIGKESFYNCDGLAKAVIPKNVKTIEDGAFYGCNGLEQVKLSEGLEEIGLRAFGYCTILTEMEIPASVSKYAYVTGVSTVYDDDYYRKNNIFAGCSSLKNLTIGGDITSINRCMLGELSGTLEELIIREGVVTIGSQAFCYATSNMTYYIFGKLRNIVLADSLITINSEAFRKNSALSTILCGPNITSIASGSIPANAALKVYGRPTDAEPEYSEAMKAYCDANGIPYLYGDDMDLLVTATFETGTDLVIEPQSVLPGGKLTAPQTPAQPGYVFTGWYNKDTGVQWSFESSAAGFEDLTLVAGWAEESLNGYYSIENGEATLLSYARMAGESANVSLPATWQGLPVTGIAAGAFAHEGIERLTLPSGLKHIDDGAFSGMRELQAIYIAEENDTFAADQGVLFTKGLASLIHYPQGKRDAGYTLPEKTESVAAGAFEGCTALASVTLNEGLVSIGSAAFRGCTGLTEITLPATLDSIGAEAFRNCLSATVVSGGDALESIGDNAFFGTDSMCVFYGDPDGLLVEYAKTNGRFYNLYMATMVVDGAAVDSFVLSTGEMLDPMDVLYPAENSFVMSWYLEETFETVWDFAAMTMPQESITLYGKVETIYDTEAIAEETTDETTGETAQTQIGVRLTGYHGPLAEITLPAELGGYPVMAIGSRAFAGSGATKITLHAAITEIAADAFDGLDGVTLIAPAGSYAEQFIADGGYASEALTYELAFETNGGTLVQPMQLACGETTALPVPVKDGCEFAGWYTDAALKTAALLDEAGMYAMPAADTTLYAAWTVNETIVYDVTWTETASDAGAYVTVTGVNTTASHVVIPAAINGLPVREIARMAFADVSTIRTISIPDSMETIGEYAFMNSGLREIAIPETVLSVGNGAMRGCRNLNAVSWPKTIDTLPDGVLAGCTALLSLSLPEGVKTLENEALMDASNLLSLMLPQSLETIGANVFSGLTRLKRLSFGANVSAIDEQAFSGFDSLTAIEVDSANDVFESVDGVLYYRDRVGILRYPPSRDGVLYEIDPQAFMIGAYAFEDAARLAQITIPDGMDSIGAYAFAGCSALGVITIPDSVTEIGPNAFDSGVTIYGGLNTAAYKYAKENGLTFTDPDAVVIPVEDVTLGYSEIILKIGSAAKLEAQITPANATSQKVVWNSSDPSVVRVDDGYLRALDYGDVVVSARVDNMTAACLIRVRDAAMEFEQALEETRVGKTLQLTCWGTIDSLASVRVWRSSDESVASVDESGLLTAHAAGIVLITAEDENGNSASMHVFVRDPAIEMDLPAALTTVMSEAFAGVPLVRAIDLRDSRLKEIGSKAFADCDGLIYAVIPESVDSIAVDAFAGCGSVTIFCEEGSAAHIMAEQAGIPYFVFPD